MANNNTYNYDLGPYYLTSRRAYEGQRKALGYSPMSPEQISGERYGELSAYLNDERAREQFLKNYQLNKRNLAYQMGSQDKAVSQRGTGQALGGVATLANIGNSMGLFGKEGLPSKALSWGYNQLFPQYGYEFGNYNIPWYEPGQYDYSGGIGAMMPFVAEGSNWGSGYGDIDLGDFSWLNW